MRNFIFILCFITCIGRSFGDSPYTLSLTKEGLILAGAAIAGVGGMIANSTLESLTIEEINKFSIEDINWLDRSAASNYSEGISGISDIFAGVMISTPIILLSDKKIMQDWKTIALMYCEVMSYSAALPYLIKGLTSRIRPYVYNSGVPFEKKLSPDARRSFFSGHTTAAFASAVFLSSVYSDYFPDSRYKTYLWVGSLIAASVVGLMRYASGAHFPTDILTGAAAGSLIGYLVPLMHNQDTDNKSITLIPPLGISFSVKF